MPIRRLLPACALVLLVAIGCADDGGPIFNNEGGQQEISCLQHQPEPPGSRYTDAEGRDTAELLAVLRYYTAHGTKPYCDGTPATEADRAWAELYIEQGADRANVAPILDAR
ncbi:MAG: hypothetical protein ACRDTC_24245 [Pseudonocardiaceae bacterium]